MGKTSKGKKEAKSKGISVFNINTLIICIDFALGNLSPGAARLALPAWPARQTSEEFILRHCRPLSSRFHHALCLAEPRRSKASLKH